MLYQLTNIAVVCPYTRCGCIDRTPKPYTGFEYRSQHPLPSRILFKRKQAVEMWVNKSFSATYYTRRKNLNDRPGMCLCQTFISRWIKVFGVVVCWGFRCFCCCCGCFGFSVGFFGWLVFRAAIGLFCSFSQPAVLFLRICCCCLAL